VAGFCRDVTLVTMLGVEEAQQQFIRSKLRPNVELQAIISEAHPTITKRRYLEPNFLTKMFEVQYLDDTPIASPLEEQVHARLTRGLKGYDLVLAADFGHGLMTERLRAFVSGCGTFLGLNTQSNSANLGFNPVTKYPRADFVCIDEPELRLAAATQHGVLPAMARQVRDRLKTGVFLVSCGPNGSLILSGDEPVAHTPALATKVVDRTGAGDALFSIAAPCAHQGLPPEVIGFVGNCVGALAVETVCNREPVDPVTLYKFITSLLK